MKQPLYIVFQVFLVSVVAVPLLYAQVPSFEERTKALGITSVSHTTAIYGNGANAIDFDLDGDIDLYVCTDGGLADRLYQNDGSGAFKEVALDLGIISFNKNRAALWFDYNGDHLQDLLVVGEGCVDGGCASPIKLALFRQRDDQTFEYIHDLAGLELGDEFDFLPFQAIGGVAAGDLNNDDYLDLVLTVWGGGIKIFENQQGRSFRDVTEKLLIGNTETMYWQPMILDVNQDGFMDIYCNVDYGPNQLWMNHETDFREEAKRYGLDHAFNEMGMSINDIDNDGDLDIYATNITQEYQGTQQHNILLKNEQHPEFGGYKEWVTQLGVAHSGWDWGCTILDFNNDGHPDIASTNGWNDDVFWPKEKSHLWMNSLAGFADVSDQVHFNDWLDATTLLAADIDGDGDQDLIQSLKDNDESNLPVHIYVNNLVPSEQTNFIVIKPRMHGANHLAIGSTVSLNLNEDRPTRLIHAGCSFYGQEPAEANFGLGRSNAMVEVVIQWPDQKVSVYPELFVNQSHTCFYQILEPPTQLVGHWENQAIQLQWNDNSLNEKGFVLEKSLDSVFNSVTHIAISENSTEYIDSEVIEEITYYYRVRAIRKPVSSTRSNAIAVEPAFEEPEAFGEDSNWVIFPNPIRRALNLRMVNDFIGTINLELSGITGQRIWSQSVHKNTQRLDWSCPISFPQGCYILKSSMDDMTLYKKVLITN